VCVCVHFVPVDFGARERESATQSFEGGITHRVVRHLT
jgi:hypothetical protein